MTREELINELLKLSIEDREFMVHEIWSSIGLDMGYDEYNEQYDSTGDENHIVKEPEAEYLNDATYQFWKGVNDKLREPGEMSQELKDLLDERMSSIEIGTAKLYDWQEVKADLEKRYKNGI